MTQQLTLFAILDDMLAYEAEKFDAEPVEFEVHDGANKREVGPYETRAEAIAVAADYPGAVIVEIFGDLNVSGADLVDAFTEWRGQLKAARPLLDELVDGLRSARDQFLVYEAHHRAKAGEDGRDEKAKTNADMAARLGALIEKASGEPETPDIWHVGELPGDDGRTIRDENGLTVAVATTAAQAFAIVEAHNAAMGEG